MSDGIDERSAADDVDDHTPLPVEGELQEILDEALTPGPELEEPLDQPRLLAGRRKGSPGKRLVKPGTQRPAFNAQQRLLLLDTWRRSGLPAGDFCTLVGVAKHTLYAWKKAFDAEGPAGVMISLAEARAA